MKNKIVIVQSKNTCDNCTEDVLCNEHIAYNNIFDNENKISPKSDSGFVFDDDNNEGVGLVSFMKNVIIINEFKNKE